jgi:hypothetical protein
VNQAQAVGAEQEVLLGRVTGDIRGGLWQSAGFDVGLFERAQEAPAPGVAAIKRRGDKLALIHAVHAPDAISKPNDLVGR